MSVATRCEASLSFPTRLGWFALTVAGDGAPRLLRVVFGHASRASAEACLLGAGEADFVDLQDLPRVVDDWVNRLSAYAQGEPVSFDDLPIAEDHLTPFGRKVVRACRAIGYGHTRSYGELAKLAGRAGAARAVGSVMAKNRIPLVVPCHRVLGAGGKLGGFSAPQGVAMKQRLLDMERGAGV